MDDIEIRPFTASDRDWLLEQHVDHYTRVEGFDAHFGVLVAQVLDDFLANHDTTRERGWIACRGEKRLGSIFCVYLAETRAQLRLFLLVPEARGRGLGHRLLQTCMGFARTRRYEAMQLWTYESHRAAGTLYARTGWQMTGSRPVDSFGKPNVEQTWEILL